MALVGFGKIARDQHMPAIEDDPRFELVAIVDPAGGEAGVPCFSSIRGLAAEGPHVDAVALCMPPRGRSKAAFAALSSQWHVLMEKPPATTVGEARAIAAMAEQCGKTLFSTWHSRENRAVDYARERLKDQVPQLLSIEWCEDVNKWHPGQEWIWEAGGFGVLDPGINALSILTHILPGPIWPREVIFEKSSHATPLRAWIAFAQKEAAHLGEAVFDWSPIGPERWTISVGTRREKIELRSGGTELFVGSKRLLCDTGREYPRLYDRFAQLIKRGKSELDLRPLELVADIFLMARSGPVGPNSPDRQVIASDSP